MKSALVLSRNTLKHIKSVVSAIFTLAKQQDYFHSENPTRDTAINPGALAEAAQTQTDPSGTPDAFLASGISMIE